MTCTAIDLNIAELYLQYFPHALLILTLYMFRGSCIRRPSSKFVGW